MKEIKIYGLCLERLRYQISNAKKKVNNDTSPFQDRSLLESYNTADIDDIIDILELYDVEERSLQYVNEKLEELAYTVSLILSETLTFDLTNSGHLGLYLIIHKENLIPLSRETVTA